MFFNKKPKIDHESKVEIFKEEIVRIKNEIKNDDLRRYYEDQRKDKIIEDKEKQISTLEKDNKDKISLAVREATIDLQTERNTYKSRCEILEKAFENLGFDVKDVKELMCKLVDGLIAKNEIKIIK
jgi:hypothetical protein